MRFRASASRKRTHRRMDAGFAQPVLFGQVLSCSTLLAHIPPARDIRDRRRKKQVLVSLKNALQSNPAYVEEVRSVTNCVGCQTKTHQRLPAGRFRRGCHHRHQAPDPNRSVNGSLSCGAVCTGSCHPPAGAFLSRIVSELTTLHTDAGVGAQVPQACKS
jgi:hypothetical protein